MKIGYARCSTTKQDLRVQKTQLRELGVDDSRIYVDHGMTGKNRQRPGLDNALAACREGDALVVTKLDRLARSVKDAVAISEELTSRGVALHIGTTVYDPTDPVGAMMFNVLAMVAQFEADLTSQRTREGLARAKAEGKMRGRRSTITDRQREQIKQWADSGEWSYAEIAEMMGKSKSTIHRIVQEMRTQGKIDSKEK